MNYYFDRIVDMQFEDAVQRVTEGLKKSGFGVLTEIDVQQTLKQKIGVDISPYRILGACNPHFAYKALQVENRMQTYDSSAELIHGNRDPMGLQYQRFTSKEIHTPQTILAVSKKREPGRTVRSRFWSIVLSQHAPHHILVNLDIEDEGDLVSDALVAEVRVSAFHLDDCQN